MSRSLRSTRQSVRREKLTWVAMIASLALLCGCQPTAAERERQSRLSSVKKVAVVTFVGKSSVSPKATIARTFTSEMFEAFQKAATAPGPVVEFIPVKSVIDDQTYQSVAKIKMPDDAFSPLEGLTYIRQGVEQGFDSAPLVRSLGVDALLMVIADFGVAVRQQASQFHLVVKLERRLIGPPEYELWDGSSQPEESIPLTLFSHPKLYGSIGAKWVVLARPSADEYGAVMQVASENHTRLPGQVGASIVTDLVKAIAKSRESSQ